jgi:uracil-DNA glycosylase
MIDIELLHEEIRRCRRCEEAGYMVQTPPLVWGGSPAPFMLIGQAPGRTDQLQNRMYRGPAAQRLFGWLKEAGFVDEDFGTTLYLTALTKCFPGRHPGKSTDRPPSNREIALCSSWLERQIEAVQPKVIILFGKMSIDRFLGAGPLTARIGVMVEKDGILYIPLPHSSGASLWLNDFENQQRLADALNQVRMARAALLNAV